MGMTTGGRRGVCKVAVLWRRTAYRVGQLVGSSRMCKDGPSRRVSPRLSGTVLGAARMGWGRVVGMLVSRAYGAWARVGVAGTSRVCRMSPRVWCMVLEAVNMGWERVEVVSVSGVKGVWASV